MSMSTPTGANCRSWVRRSATRKRLPQVVIGAELALVVRAAGELGRGVAGEPRVGGLAELDAVEAGDQPRGGQRCDPAAVARRVRAARSRPSAAIAASGWQLARLGVREPGAR